MKTPPEVHFLLFGAHLKSDFPEIVLRAKPAVLFQGAGTEEACLIDVLASRTNDEVKAINAFYKKREWSCD